MTYLDTYSLTYLDTYGVPSVSSFSTLPNLQIKIDWVNNPIGSGAVAGSNWTDISAYVRLDQGVTITRGRQDNISTVQPGRCTFTVANDDGRFTPNLSTSPYSPGVVIGRRVQVNVADEVGVFHTRFDGMINEFDIQESPTSHDSMMQIVCIDVLGFLNRYPGLSCWTVQECLALNPMLQYVMNEPANSAGLFDTSGNSGPVLVPATYQRPLFTAIPNGAGQAFLSAPTITYQSGNSPVEAAVPPTLPANNGAVYPPINSTVSSPLPSVKFGMTMNQDTGANTHAAVSPSSQFQGTLTKTLKIGTDNFTVLGWVWPDWSINGDTYNNCSGEIVCLSNSASGAMLALECAAVSSVITYQAKYYPNFPGGPGTGSATSGFNSTTYFLNAPVMVAVVVSGNTATFYLGGNLFGIGATLLTGATTVTIPSGVTFDYLSIGGPLSGGYGFAGNISLVNVYDYALNSTQLNDLQTIGAQGPYGQTMSGAATRVAATYTGLPSYWTGTVDSGLSVCDFVDLTSVNPGSMLQTLQQVEHGLVFTDATGKLNFHDRSRRMGAAAPAVLFPAGSYDVGLQPKFNDQYLLNSEALQNQRAAGTVIAQNATSIAKYGVYPNGDQRSPVTGPYFIWQGITVQRQVATPTSAQSLATYGTDNLADAANWDVNTRCEPAMKLAAPTIDILANLNGQDEYVQPSTVFGIEINQAVKFGQNLSWWPDAPQSSELFIEGVTENYTDQSAKVGFYTSPAYQARGWLPGDSTYGKIDSTARVGISKEVSPLVQTYSPLVPTFASGMNLGAGSNGFVGARDIVGLYGNLQLQLQPPLLFVDQVFFTQSLANGLTSQIIWDSFLIDTTGMMNQYVNANTAATVVVPGWYEATACVQFAANATGERIIWITQVQTNAVRQLGTAAVKGTSAQPTGVSTSAVFWCNAGDAIAVSALQNSGGALSTSLPNGGSEFTMRFIGSGSARN